MNKIGIISLSGGIDSTSLLLNLLSNNYKVFALSFNYGQKHRIEIEKAKENIKYLSHKSKSISHKVIDISDCMGILDSSLTNSKKNIPEGFYEEQNMTSTVVPNRNAIFISIIFGYAITISQRNPKSEIYLSLGAHSGDHAIYPDCRAEFYNHIIKSFKIGNWDTERINLYLPYINIDKSEILKDALKSCKLLNLNFHKIFKNTITSYNPNKNGLSDGKTGSDIERILAFDKIGLKDPLNYNFTWEEVLDNAKKTEKNFKES